MRSRRSVLVVVLQLIILACGPLNPLATPAGDSHVDITPGVIQSTPTASSSEASRGSPGEPPLVTPTHLPDLGLPWFSIPTRAIHVAHDDMGRIAAITSGQIAKWGARGSQRPYLVG